MIEKWKGRTIQSRADAAELLLDMIRPLKPYYSKGNAWLHAGDSGVHYGEKSSRMEGFARVLWGLGPLWSQESPALSKELKEEAEEWKQRYLSGIIHGTDPSHEEYWGDLVDYDQKMVEMAALAVAVSLSPKTLWEPLNTEQKKRFFCWMNQINDHGVHPNNWRFFRILVNTMFRMIGCPWSKVRMEEDRAVIEGCYEGDGWYHDGNKGQLDYYIPFAIHFYGLLYAKFMVKEDPEYSYILKERGRKFADDFIYWFDKDGREIPYGRSLTYRFAHGAFFSAAAFAEVEEIDYGVYRRLAVGNLMQWISHPIFNHAGILSIGYGYPNLFMSERYNGPGSPYWGLKTFFMLALSDSHPFWTAPDRFPVFEPIRLLTHPHMLVVHENDHAEAFVAGQHCQNHGCVSEKYEKFVYSNQFGFSVSRGHRLQDGAFDNTLAASLAGDEHYRMKYGTNHFRVTEQAVFLDYTLMPGVEAESAIIPLGPWHIRIHHISTDKEIDTADGGFSIEAETCFEVQPGALSGKYRADQIKQDQNSIFACLPWGISGAAALTDGEAKLIDTFPNTNLLYNLAILPTICRRLKPGCHLLIDCFLADRTDQAERYMKCIPQVETAERTIRIRIGKEERSIQWPDLKQED